MKSFIICPDLHFQHYLPTLSSMLIYQSIIKLQAIPWTYYYLFPCLCTYYCLCLECPLIKMLFVDSYSFFSNSLKGYTFGEAFPNSCQVELVYYFVVGNILKIPPLNMTLVIHLYYHLCLSVSSCSSMTVKVAGVGERYQNHLIGNHCRSEPVLWNWTFS